MFTKIVLIFTLNFCVIYCEDCLEGTYFDPVTARCDPCYFICFMAEIQATIDQCHKWCPNYTENVSTSRGIHQVKAGGATSCGRQTTLLIAVVLLLITVTSVLVVHVCYTRLNWRHGDKNGASGWRTCCRKDLYPDLVSQTNAFLTPI
ncbi:uncharacterized protein LOC121380223 [Gigantopelta aegis]|uniref:uncharacterized protein LOC121380223 n=1 Tax=Gigantopelta aegis TaxID=1735272 RepID=UPI001B88A7EF|nr:uncharacterized protein LOC121380223 [Gigantopelta aegis]XP_041364977.1 uncharacterized protein LOC121380223 [Gigantopelta aegis]